jgi:hypothetical protein
VDIRQSWIPSALTLQDHTLTLEVTAWGRNLDAAAEKGGSGRAAYLISLAALGSGDFIFHLNCTHLAEQPDGRYRPVRTEDASMPFTIPVSEKSIAAATLVESILKSTSIVAGDTESEFVPPIHWARLGRRDSTTNPVFRVGSIDAYKHMEGFHDDDRLPAPQLDVNPAGEYFSGNLVALINPRIESGDFIQLSSIAFLGSDIVITVDYWQDLTPRAAVVPESPFILIPFDSIPKGNHKMTLRWRTYQGYPDAQSPTFYSETAPEGPFKPMAISITVK